MNIRNISCTPIVKINSNKILKSKNMPIVTTPLLAYYIGEYQDDNVDKILNFLNNKHIPVPSALTPHSLTKTGWDPASQTKVKNTLKNAFDKNQITEDEYNKYSEKIKFTGHPDNIDAPEANLDSDIIGEPPKIYDVNCDLSNLDSESREMLDEINNTDMSLPPDLQEIIDMPSIDTPDGFLDTIFGELPDGMSVPSDIWSMLKGIAHNILDLGDLF